MPSCLVKLDAGRLEFQAAEFQEAAHTSLRVLHDIFMPDSKDPPWKNGVPMSHQVKIGPVVTSDVVDAVGELLPPGKQLLEVAEAAAHGFTPRIDNLGVRHHEVDEPDVLEVVRHLIDEERLLPAIRARVGHVALAEPAE